MAKKIVLLSKSLISFLHLPFWQSKLLIRILNHLLLFCWKFILSLVKNTNIKIINKFCDLRVFLNKLHFSKKEVGDKNLTSMADHKWLRNVLSHDGIWLPFKGGTLSRTFTLYSGTGVVIFWPPPPHLILDHAILFFGSFKVDNKVVAKKKCT